MRRVNSSNGQRRRCTLLALAAAAALPVISSRLAYATTGSFTNTAGGSWAVNGNWSGANFATGQTQTGTFNAAYTAGASVNIGSGIAIGTLGIAGSANSFSITGTGALTVGRGTAGGIYLTSSASSQTFTFYPSISVVGPTTGSLTFANNSASGLLDIEGGVSATTGAAVLNLGGTNTSNSNVINGQITDGTGLSLAKVDAGTWTLTASNAYTGSTTLSGGILRLTGSHDLGSGATSINNGGTLRIENVNATLGSTVSVNSGGMLDLATASSVSTLGTLTVNSGGIVRLSNMGAIGSSYTASGGGIVDINVANADLTPITLGANGVLRLSQNQLTGTAPGGSASAFTFNNTTLQINAASISTQYAPTFNNGTLGFAGNGTYTNAILLTGSSTVDFGSGAPAMLGGISAPGANVTLNVSSANSGSFQAGITDGAGGQISLAKFGTGTVALNFSNSYTGNTTINAGTLVVADINGLGGGTGGVIISSGGTYTQKTTNQVNAAFLSGSGTLATFGNTGTLNLVGSGDYTYSGTMQGTAANVVLSSSSLTEHFTGSNSFSSSRTAVNAGTLSLEAAFAGGAGTMAVGGGNLIATTADSFKNTQGINLNSGLLVLGPNSSSGSAVITVGGGTFSVTGANALSGSSALVISTGGTYVPAFSNNYTGGTTINSTSTMQIGSASALANIGSGTVTLNAGTLDLMYNTGAGLPNGLAVNASAVSGLVIVDDVASGTAANMTLGPATVGNVSASGTLTIQRGNLGVTGTPTITLGNVTLTTVSGATVRPRTLAPIGVNLVVPSVTSASLISSGGDQFKLDGTGQGFITGSIASTGGGTLTLFKQNTSTWTLQSSNTFNGGSQVNGGTLIIQDVNALGTGSLTLGGGTLDLQLTAALPSVGTMTVTSGMTSGLILDRPAASPGAANSYTVSSLVLNSDNNNTGLYVIKGANATNSPSLTLSSVTGAQTASNNGTVILGASAGATMSIGNVSLTSTFTNKSIGMVLAGTSTGNVVTGSLFTSPSGNGTTYALTKQDSGSWSIPNSQSFVASTTVSGGTLTLGNPNALGPSSNAVTLNGGALDLATDTPVAVYGLTVNGNAFSGIFSDRGTSGSGIEHILGNVVLSGTTNTLELGRGANSTGTASITLGNFTGGGQGVTFQVDDNVVAKIGMFGVSGQAPSFSKTGNGTLIMPVATAAGSTNPTLNGGALRLFDASSMSGTANVPLNFQKGLLSLADGTPAVGIGTADIGASNITWHGTTGANAGTIELDRLSPASAGVLHTGYALTMDAGSTFNLVGGSNINSGTAELAFGNITTAGFIPLAVTGDLNFNIVNPVNGGVTELAMNNALVDDGTQHNLNVTGNGILQISSKQNAGSILFGGTISLGSSSTLILAGTNNGSGSNALGNGTAYVSNSGTVILTASQSVKALYGSGVVNLSAGTLTENNTIARQIDGTILGSGGLTAAGSATLTLNASNSYTGPTSVTGGILSLTAANAISGGTATASGGNIIESANNAISTAAGLAVSSASSTVTLSNSNNFSGPTSVSNGTLALTAAGAISASTVTYSGGTLTQSVDNALTGTTALVVNAVASTFSLDHASNRSGVTTITAGSLNLGAVNQLGSGSVNLNGGTLAASSVLTGGNKITNNAFLSANSSIGGSNDIELGGSFSNISASHTLTNSFSASGSDMQQLILSGPVSLTDGASRTVTLAGTGNTYISGSIADGVNSSSVNFSGTGTLTLAPSTPNTFSNRLSLSGGGNLVFASAGAISAGGGSINNGTLYATAPNAISGTATLNVSGGTAHLQNSNNSTGATTLSNGTLSLEAAGAISASAVTVSNGTFSESADNALSGTAALTVNGGASITLANANSYAGTTIVGNAATLTLNNSLSAQNSTVSVGATANVLFNAGLGTATLGNLAGAGPLALQDTAGSPAVVALTAGGNGTTSTYSGSLTGSGSLTKTGTGALTLASTSTYGGGTSVTAGTLSINGALTNSNAITVNAANLVLGSANAIPSAASISGLGSTPTVTANASQTFTALTSTGTSNFTAGNSTIGSIGGTGAMTVASGATVNATNALNHGSINNAGVINVNGGASNVIGTIDGSTGVFNVNAGSTTATHYRQATLAVASGATATIADSVNPGNTAAAGYANTLSVNAAGTFDIMNNSMVVEYGTAPSPFTTVAGLIKQAYNGGAWDQPGITSTSARSNSGQYGVGYSELAPLGTNTFEGQTVSSGNAVLIKYTLRGDTTLKGGVGLQDYNTVLANFNTAQGWSGGNFDYSGTVNLNDYNNVLANFNLTATGSSVIPSDAMGPIAPPSSMKLAAATAGSSGASTDMRLEVNVASGAVFLLAQTAVSFTGYNIVDPAHKLRNGKSTLLSSSNNKWAIIENDTTAVAEGQNKGIYKSTSSATWDTIQLTAGQTIQFGNIYNPTSGVQDLTFQFSEANTSTGDPTTGITFTLGAGNVDYFGGTVTPEPGSVSLLAIGVMGLLGRRRRRLNSAR